MNWENAIFLKISNRATAEHMIYWVFRDRNKAVGCVGFTKKNQAHARALFFFCKECAGGGVSGFYEQPKLRIWKFQKKKKKEKKQIFWYKFGGGEIGILNEIYMKRQREKNLDMWVIEQTGV